jgi:hypothetical protein
LFCSNVSLDGQCLLNVPSSQPIEATYVETSKGAGSIWSPDDQCKMAFGKNASFCHVCDFDFRYIDHIHKKYFL